MVLPGLQELMARKASGESVRFDEFGIRSLGSKLSITYTICNKVAFIDSSRKIGLQCNAMDAIEPIYQNLTKPDLLGRCIGGFIQNMNESFNQSIRKLIPKQGFRSLSVLEIGVYIAVTCINDDKAGFLQVMKNFNVEPGSSALNWAKAVDNDRLFWSDRRASESTLEARRTRRKRNHPDDDSYQPGAY